MTDSLVTVADHVPRQAVESLPREALALLALGDTWRRGCPWELLVGLAAAEEEAREMDGEAPEEDRDTLPAPPPETAEQLADRLEAAVGQFINLRTTYGVIITGTLLGFDRLGLVAIDQGDGTSVAFSVALVAGLEVP